MPGRKNARAGRPRRVLRLRVVILGAAAVIAACGVAAATGSAAGSGSTVMVQEEKEYTRAERIAMWKETLERNGEELPDVSGMTTEEIEEGHSAAMLKYATPAEMPVAPACVGWDILLPSCW